MTSFGFGLNAQIVNIPDANFKAYLVGNTSVNTNADAEIQVTEATAFTGFLDCVGLGISDMTGIEAFTGVTTLDCTNNTISALDVTQNTALDVLYCADNSLTTLDVTQNTSLTQLFCGINSLTALDVSQNTSLTQLGFYANAITTMDVSMHTGLIIFIGNNNALTSLNVANGNNSNVVLFEADNNPNLTCIQVDDVAYSTTNWAANIDATASFSTDCSAGIAELDAQSINVYPNPSSSQITIETESTVEEVSIYNTIGTLVQSETSASFTVDTLPTGVYVVNVITNDGLFLSRFVKK